MKAPELKANQAELKESYKSGQKEAVQQLKAVGEIDPDNLACIIKEPGFLSPAGLHPGSGGDGTFACSVEIMLAGWLSCAGVTMAAVANSMKVNIESGTVTAIGTIDFRGTLAVDRDAPIGLTKLELRFDVKTDADDEAKAKLLQLTERYCVVHQTLLNAPEITASYE